MKKAIFIFCLFAMIQANAQDRQLFEQLIAQGKYEDAKIVLNVLDNKEPEMTWVNACIKLQKEARSLLQKEYYTKAIEKYRLIKRYFPSDRTVDAAIRQCEIKRDEYNRMQEQKRREEQARQARSAEEEQWQRAVILNTKVGYIDYLNKYPAGKYRNTARTRLFDLYVNDARNSYSSGDYRDAVNSFDMASRYGTLSLMSGRMYRLAKEKMEEQELLQREESSYEILQKGYKFAYEFENFLRDYPDSRHAPEIRGKLLNKYCLLGRFDDARELVENFPEGIASTDGSIRDLKYWMAHIKQQERGFPKKAREIHPRFKGKNKNAFSEWVNKRLVYPNIAKSKGIEGTVMIQFTIDTDGTVKNVIVIQGVDSSLDAEAVRVVSKSPKWKPGRKYGKPMSVTYTFPVVFQLK